MGFFSNKKTSVSQKGKEIKAKCACGGECKIEDIENAKIIVLGACCKKSSETFENVKTAAIELGINETVVNVGDVLTIAKYGVMSTPALVVNSKVVCQGKLVTVALAKDFLKDFIN